MEQNREYKIVLISDIHISKTNRMGDRIHALKQVSEYVNANNIDLLVDLGDTFEKANPTEEERIVYSKFLSHTNCIKYKISGNHETIDNITFAFESSLHLGKFMENNWVAGSNSFEVGLNENASAIFCNYSYENDIKGYVKGYKHLPKNKLYFFGHCTVNGAKANSGYKFRNDAIDATTFAPFEFAFLGDIHKRQMYKNWGYVGALVKKDAGEAGNLDGFTVVTIHEDGSFSQEFIEVDGRDYITIEYKEGEETLGTSSGIKNNIIKVILTGSSAWLATLNIEEMRKQIMEYNSYKISFERNSTDVKERISISENLSEEEQLKEYCKTNDVNENTTNKGLKFLNEHLKIGE